MSWSWRESGSIILRNSLFLLSSVRAIFGDLTGDAYEFNATLPAKEKLIEQNHAHIEDQERVKARNQAEIAAQNQELEQLKASVAEFKTKYCDALRFEELK